MGRKKQRYHVRCHRRPLTGRAVAAICGMNTEGELVYCIRNNVGGLMDRLQQIRRERMEQEGMGGE